MRYTRGSGEWVIGAKGLKRYTSAPGKWVNKAGGLVCVSCFGDIQPQYEVVRITTEIGQIDKAKRFHSATRKRVVCYHKGCWDKMLASTRKPDSQITHRRLLAWLVIVAGRCDGYA